MLSGESDLGLFKIPDDRKPLQVQDVQVSRPSSVDIVATPSH